MSDGRRVYFDDLFDSYSTIVGSNFVTLYDVRLRLTRFSESLAELIGLDSPYLEDGVYDWIEYIHPEDRDVYDAAMEEMFALRKKNYDITYRVRLRDGDYTLFRLIGGVIRDESGHPGVIGGMMIPSGIIERTDRVTSMRNLQAFLDDMMDSEICDENTSFLLIGFGRMTHINEVYGYGHGNRLLIKVSEILDDIIDGRGEIYRTSGSKFAISFFDISDEEIMDIYKKIQARFREGVKMENGIVHNLFAYGGYIRFEEEIEANRSIYDCLVHSYNESKRYRHGELVLYHGSNVREMSIKESLTMIRDIRESINRDFEGFYLMYQPVFAEYSEPPIGAEVILYWKNDKYSVVRSDEFLSEIEQDYIYERLSSWLLKNAFRDARGFYSKYPDFRLFITVTQSQIWTPYFVGVIEEFAHEYGFPIDSVYIQIDRESRLLTVEKIIEFSKILKKRNISFGIDDFARGNAYLKVFSSTKPDFVRFSDELVSDLSDDTNMIILSHLVEMSASCGTDVYIKGIKDKATGDGLKRLPVSGFQGEYYSRPVYYDEVLAYYDSKNTDN
ncbi:MAG: EAL domain-containing protein [Eubacterium sp.]|nr:EAL domain-containing protein [Eubacterium sp.]